MKKLLQYFVCLPLATASLWFSVRAQSMNAGAIVKLDPSLDRILPPDGKLELLKGEGSFEGGEGPLWIQHGESGYLLFSDVSGNRILQWSPDCLKFPCSGHGKLSVFLDHSGYADLSRVGSVDGKKARLHLTPIENGRRRYAFSLQDLVCGYADSIPIARSRNRRLPC